MEFNSIKTFFQKNMHQNILDSELEIIEAPAGILCKVRDERHEFNEDDVKLLIETIQQLSDRFPAKKKYVFFEIPNVGHIDKLPICLMECVIYYAIMELGISVLVELDLENDMITEQMSDSPFFYLKQDHFDEKKFLNKFVQDYSGHRLRKIVKYDPNNIPQILSEMTTDIMSLLQLNNVSPRMTRSTAKMIAELLENALNHGKDDCLIDIDITNPNFIKNTEKNKLKPEKKQDRYEGINIIILSFSDVELSDLLRKKMKRFTDDTHGDKVNKYKKLKTAEQNHGQYFDDKYTSDFFWTIASLQHRISGREGEFDTNGVGLTKLVEEVRNYSDNDYCLVASGNRLVSLNKAFLNVYVDSDDDEWVGFNESGNFVEESPNKDAFSTTALDISGTGYSLSFAAKYEVEKNNGKNN